MLSDKAFGYSKRDRRDLIIVGSNYFVGWIVGAAVITPALASEWKRNLVGLRFHTVKVFVSVTD